MQLLETYFGITPFDVQIDDSPVLRGLARQAQELRHLPLPKRLTAIKKLALEAMVNAYEQMLIWEEEVGEQAVVQEIDSAGQKDNIPRERAQQQYQKYHSIVFQQHPLSDALEQKAGCCRYQGALFFILAYEADLGDKHFLQAAAVNNRVSTVFNQLLISEQQYTISIFTESLQNQKYDYTRTDPTLFQRRQTFPGREFYSYHRQEGKLLLVSNPADHIQNLPPLSKSTRITTKK